MRNLIKRELSLQGLAANEAGEPAKPDDAHDPREAPEGDIAAQVATAKRAAADRPEEARPRSCLVVDDSRMIRKVARRIVEGIGFAVTEAENGEEAIARCRAAMPDLVLTDWNMPVLAGPEFVATLRALPDGARAKVVFCTSKSGASDIHEGIGAGADDWIVKPFDELGLRRKLETLGFS